MPAVVECWTGTHELPTGHGDVVLGAYPGDRGRLLTRDHAIAALDLALKVAGYDQEVAALRAAIAEDAEAAMIKVSERPSRPTSGVPPLRSGRGRPR